MGQTSSNARGRIQLSGAASTAARRPSRTASPVAVFGLILAMPCGASLAAVGHGAAPPDPIDPDLVQRLAAAFFIAPPKPPAAADQFTERGSAEAAADAQRPTVALAPPVPAPLAPEAIRRLAGSLHSTAEQMSVAAPPVSQAPSSRAPQREGGSADVSDDPAADQKAASSPVGPPSIGSERARAAIRVDAARDAREPAPASPETPGRAVQAGPPASAVSGRSAAMPPAPGQNAGPAVGLWQSEAAPSTAGAGGQATSRAPLDPARVGELAIDMATATQAMPADPLPGPSAPLVAPAAGDAVEPGLRPLPETQMDMIRGVFDPES